MRDLAAKCLHKLTAQAPEYMANTVLPQLVTLSATIDLYLRHGAILSAGYITHALAQLAWKQNK